MVRKSDNQTGPRTANQNPEIPGLWFGKVLLGQGARESREDSHSSVQDMVHILRMMELNRKHRQKPKSNRDKIRGLFGGNR